jgi:ATP-binding cassette subfamily F protein 3
MVELTADRLVLVDDGQAVDYPGTIDDYIDFVLGRNQPKAAPKPKVDKKTANKAREAAAALKKKATEAEAASARLAAQCWALDKAMFDPSSAAPELAGLPMSELASRRAKVAADLAAAEARWVEAAEKLEQAAA